MGFSVSATYALIALAILAGFGTLYTATHNAGEEVTEGVTDQWEQSQNVAKTDIEIVDAAYNIGTGNLRVSIKNTGNTHLSTAHTDILVDGEYITLTPQNTSIEGKTETQTWAQGENIQITVNVSSPDRVKVVTEHGVAAFTAVKTFTLTNNIVFTDNDAIKVLGTGQSITPFNENAQIIGAPVAQFGSNDVVEVPAIDSNGNVFLIDENGQRTDLVTGGVKNSKSKITAGRWQGSNPSVFYATDSNNNENIARVTADGTTTTLSATPDKADAVAGIADVDGDGADELVFGGSGGSGSDDTVRYIDDDGTTIIPTEVNYGSNNGIGLGEPADFDGDGKARTPIVGGSQEIKLADENGNTEFLTSGDSPNKSPLGTADLDTDGDPEIYFVGQNQKLRYVDDVTGQNTVKDVTDSTGGSVPVDSDAGVA